MAFTLRLLLTLALLVPLPALALSIEGRAEAVDGDTLHVSGHKVRLFGIDAPELGQTCDRGGRGWACGASAREMLEAIVARGRVACTLRDVDRYGRDVAVCKVAGDDIAALMVRQGGAIAYRRYSERYVNAENAARREGIGLWSARWVAPEDYRHSGGAQAVPEGCAIKGNVGRSGKRIYHLPGQADYASTRIDPRRGEQWFCSEAEARAAGFRRAAR